MWNMLWWTGMQTPCDCYQDDAGMNVDLYSLGRRTDTFVKDCRQQKDTQKQAHRNKAFCELTALQFRWNLNQYLK